MFSARILIAMSLLLCILVFAGCGGGGGSVNSSVVYSTADYYPMTEGSTWTYAKTSDVSMDSGTIQIQAVAAKQVNGKTAYGMAREYEGNEHHTAYWSIEYVVSDEQGIRTVGGQSTPDLSAIPDDVFINQFQKPMLPSTLRLGDEWTAQMSNSPTDIWRYKVIATGQTVTTPAGTFTNCIKVRTEPAVELSEITRHTVVYAPGVGMVSKEWFTTMPPPPGQSGWSSATVLVSYHIAE